MNQLEIREEEKCLQKQRYSKGEEIFNMVTHIVGAALGVVTTVLCVIFAAKNHNVYGIISGAIFGSFMIILYTMSSIYHGLSPKLKAKGVFRILDHCSIFLLIIGSYTPIALCSLRQYDTATGWIIYGIVLLISVIGIVLNSINMKKFKTISIILYIVIGWCILAKITILPKLLGLGGFVLLLSGGIVYTIGAILYAIGKKKKWMHSIFHIFIVIGSLLHFLCVLLYVV